MKRILIFGNPQNIWMFLAIAVALTLSVSCSSDDDILNVPSIPVDSSQAVCFTTKVENCAETRGTPITAVSQLTTMGVFCSKTESDWNSSVATPNKMFNQQMNYNSGAWSYQGAPIYWGATELTDRYSFFAYAPFGTGTGATGNGITIITTTTTPDIPWLRYDVPTDVTKQPDLMFAVPRYNLRPLSGQVALSMKHVLTSVGFQIKGDGEKITGISISNVVRAGQWKVDGSAILDGGIGTSIDFSPSINYDSGKNYYTATSTMSTNLIAGDGYLMMVPQTLDQNAKVKVEIQGENAQEFVLNPKTWSAGQKITYAITLKPKFDPTILPTGTGLFEGRTSFDIAFGNNGINKCSPVSSRNILKTDFANRTVQELNATPNPTYSGVQVYTFTPSGSVSKVRFAYIDASGKCIESIAPNADYTGNAISTPCKVTVNFKESLNNELKTLTRDQALKPDLYVVYNDAPNGNGNDKALKLTLMLQDCSYCGAKTASGGWLTFMCHNLGADETKDPFTTSGNFNTTTGSTKGRLYQPGTDSPDIRLASSPSSDAWGAGITTKGAKDPCPDGWKIPSASQWASILAANSNPSSITYNSTVNKVLYGNSGLKIGDALFLPVTSQLTTGGGMANGTIYETTGYYWTNEYGRLIFYDGPNTVVYQFRGVTEREAYAIRCVSQ